MLMECNGKPIVFFKARPPRSDGGRLPSDVDALGYEDLSEQDQLRDDSVLALAVGRGDITGADQVRERERGHPLASSSTLNRLVLGTPDKAAEDRCKRISADPAAIDRLLVALSLEAHGTAPEEIVLDLDLDATDDPLYGAQEGRHFHAHEESTAYRKFPSLAAIGDMCLPRFPTQRNNVRVGFQKKRILWVRFPSHGIGWAISP